MRKLILLLVILLNSLLVVDLFAQDMPLVFDVENTGADCPIPYLPSFSELPTIQSLPDPFEWADGKGRMKNYSDWRIRRAEIGAQIQNYEIGVKPPRPDSITASYSGGVLTVHVAVGDQTLTLSSQVVLPSGSGPFPAVIGMNSPSGSIPSSIFTTRNIAEITFRHNQVTTYGSPSNSDPYYQLYPNLNVDNTGQYSAWAWGVSRIIDGLELVQNVLPIDLKHIAVTGCSYAGKMALFAGALDERIALTIAQESGGGGATSWRYSQSEPNGTVEKIDNTDYNWFMNSMKQFASDKVSLLPEDHHELMAMCAPRALYVTANPNYTWLSNPSCYVCSEGCKTVYDALGIPDRFGFSVVGGHLHCAVPDSQIPEIGAFVDKFLLGKDTVNTNNISDKPDTYGSINLSQWWITWANPTLANDTTYFATLAYPPSSEIGLDTSITFKWSKVKNAEKYFIQLSTDPTFKSVDLTDSTTDTVKTINDLSKAKKYYWRVQGINSDGSGLWSNAWNFVTTLTLPDIPQLISASPYKNGYIAFKWDKINDADKYIIQVSNSQSFGSVLKTIVASDIADTVSWFSEGQMYYWRARATNIAGTSLYSDALDFVYIYAPTNLVLQNSGSNEITLSWKDNSSIEDGFVIERKENPQTNFTVLDTLKGGNEYVDKNAEQTQTYTYRVKAYNDSLESQYSNEASLNPTGIKEEGEMPAMYSISQNYPNPFNPTTAIKFALPKSAVTKIIVYDIIGREIRTLINKELKGGYYEISFDASNLPSGVYFYRIQSGDFIQTKKMILMK